MSVNVQITLSNTEYEKIKKDAAEKGLTPAQYIKHCAVDDSEFESRYDYLKQQALHFPEGQVFTVMSIFSDWNEIELGIRLSLGRTFYHLVKRGGLSPVIPAGKNSNNVQLYMVKKTK